MHKELNPELFGEKKLTHRHSESVHAEHLPETHFLNTDRQILELRNQNQALHDQVSKLTAGMNELVKNANLKFERFAQSLHRLEQSHNGLAHESGQKFNQIGQKVTERKLLDVKIQEMVDRHNNIIKTFEVRMNHLQKLLSEKEAQMLSTQTALNDAKMEIARLKRL